MKSGFPASTIFGPFALRLPTSGAYLTSGQSKWEAKWLVQDSAVSGWIFRDAVNASVADDLGAAAEGAAAVVAGWRSADADIWVTAHCGRRGSVSERPTWVRSEGKRLIHRRAPASASCAVRQIPGQR